MSNNEGNYPCCVCGDDSGIAVHVRHKPGVGRVMTCPRCWELGTRIENDIDLARAMVETVDRGLDWRETHRGLGAHVDPTRERGDGGTNACTLLIHRHGFSIVPLGKDTPIAASASRRVLEAWARGSGWVVAVTHATERPVPRDGRWIPS